MGFKLTFCATVLLFIAGAAGALADGDATAGKAVFNKCRSCHKAGDVSGGAVGPLLTGVVGRKAGTFADFSYSATMKAAGDQGLVWDEKSIGDYVQGPGEFLKKYLTDKGKADLMTDTPKMTFKLTDPTLLPDLIAFLKSTAK